jgi:hypothetical protein
LGNAETEGDARIAASLPANARQTFAASHNPTLQIMFSSIKSKLHCLQSGTGSFCAPTGADPVGAGRYPKKVSCRRKRLHAPEGETQNA